MALVVAAGVGGATVVAASVKACHLVARARSAGPVNKVGRSKSLKEWLQQNELGQYAENPLLTQFKTVDELKFATSSMVLAEEHQFFVNGGLLPASVAKIISSLRVAARRAPSPEAPLVLAGARGRCCFDCLLGRASGEDTEGLSSTRPSAEAKSSEASIEQLAFLICRSLYASAADESPEATAIDARNSANGMEILVNGLRAFLRERSSGKYLTVIDAAPHPICVLTEKAASLMKCRSSGGAQVNSLTTFALEHEGIPALGKFLSSEAARPAFGGLGQKSIPLQCQGLGNTGGEIFVRHPNSTIQHRYSMQWLWADLETNTICLHGIKKSTWDFVPAVHKA